MIKDKRDIACIEVENEGNILGQMRKELLLTPEEMQKMAKMFSIINLSPGSRIKEHHHEEDAEIYYMLEGDVEVTDDGEVRQLKAGDVMFTGRGHRHSVYNRGGITARFIACILK